MTGLPEQLKFRNLSLPSGSIVFMAAVLLFLVLGAAPTVFADTEIYHLQIIRWTNEYGTVPGLANLYPRLGLGSAWFNLVSIFHIPLSKDQNFTYLNTTVAIWFFAWLLYKLEQHRKSAGNHTFCLFYFLLIAYCFFDWQVFRNAANSTSYDFAITVFTVLCLSWLTENILIDDDKKFSFAFIIAALTVPAFKLSGVFILIPVLAYLLKFRNAGTWIKVLVTGLIIISPIIIKNYITTGYPLYPVTIGLGSPDWQLPKEMTDAFRNYILNTNRFYNSTVGFISSQEKTGFNWIPFWIQGVLIKHKILLLVSILSSLLFFVIPSHDVRVKKLKLLFAGLCLMALSWFFTAPDPRFAFGFLLFMALFPISLLCGRSINTKIYTPALWILAAGILFYGYRKAVFIKSNPAYLIHPVAVTQPSYERINVNGIAMNHAKKINGNWNNRCFFTPLPCFCEENPYIRIRGDKLENGFRMVPKPDSAFINQYNY